MIGSHQPGRHVTVTHQALTIRTPGQPTEHRPLRSGELDEWLSTLEVPLTPDERSRLLAAVRELASTE
jgi:N-hydroxyarylamine O-acetyltransferase